MSRIKKLINKIKTSKQINGLLITNPVSLNYLTKTTYFTPEGREGIGFVSPKQTILFVSPLVYDQLKNNPCFRTVVNLSRKSDLKRYLEDKLSKQPVLGFEANDLKWQSYQTIKKWLKVRLKPAKGLVEDLRTIKEAEEITSLHKAIHLTQQAFDLIAEKLRPGKTETQIAWEMERLMREAGGDGLGFPIIVASGSNSAIPHYQTGKRKIRANDIVLIDAGCKIDGYCSDMSRTFFVGKPKPEWLKVYKIVKKAQQKVIKFLNTNPPTGGQIQNTNPIETRQIDSICRDYIKNQGFDGHFIHSTGHGIGLEIHEQPHINPKSNTVLKKGMVFTIEPGIYLTNKFGVRIEDIVIFK